MKKLIILSIVIASMLCGCSKEETNDLVGTEWYASKVNFRSFLDVSYRFSTMEFISTEEVLVKETNISSSRDTTYYEAKEKYQYDYPDLTTIDAGGNLWSYQFINKMSFVELTKNGNKTEFVFEKQ